RAVDEDVNLLLPLVSVPVRLHAGLKAEIAHAAVLAVERNASETDVELLRVDAEVPRLVLDLQEIDVAVLAHCAPPSRGPCDRISVRQADQTQWRSDSRRRRGARAPWEAPRASLPVGSRRSCR